MASRRKRGPVAFRPRLLAGLAFSDVTELYRRVNSGMYILLHNVFPGMSGMGQKQPLSIISGERLVSGCDFNRSTQHIH
jgi:hypothetical protein